MMSGRKGHRGTVGSLVAEAVAEGAHGGGDRGLRVTQCTQEAIEFTPAYLSCTRSGSLQVTQP